MIQLLLLPIIELKNSANIRHVVQQLDKLFSFQNNNVLLVLFLLVVFQQPYKQPSPENESI